MVKGKDVATLANEALASKTSLPNIATLLDLIDESKTNSKNVHAAAAAVTHVYTHLLDRGDLLPREKGSFATSKKHTQAELKVAAWLRDHLDLCIDKLSSLISSDEPALQILSVDSLLILCRHGTANLHILQKNASEWAFENGPFIKIVNTLACTPPKNSHQIVNHLISLLNTWDDLRLYFYRNLGKLASSSPKLIDSTVVYEILSQIHSEQDLTGLNWVSANDSANKTLQGGKKRKQAAQFKLNKQTKNKLNEKKQSDDEQEEEDEEEEEIILPSQSKSVQRKAFTDCWLAFLKIRSLPQDVYKKVLLIMHKIIIPHMTQPTLLIDFLTDSYNAGGAISLLALNGLFTDYPDFYTKLYTLLDKQLLSVKYRSRFFRLLDLFLSSAYLPAYLVAAFAKRLSRLALVASPSGIVIVIPFVYNLMKRHPAIITIIHRDEKKEKDDSSVDEQEEIRKNVKADNFIMSENDPSKCRALESSLWELHTLSTHFLPSISSLATIFQEPFTKPVYDIEDFLDLSYDGFFELEASKAREAAEGPETPMAALAAASKSRE
ncbi:hypothetical protein HK100_004554, partial [Physocladia obscura]